MNIINIILIVLGVIVAIILVIILILLFFPFEYVLDLSFANDEKLELKFKYIIFKITGFLIYKPKVSYEFKLWNKVLAKNDEETEDDEEVEEDIDDEEIEDEDVAKDNSIEEDDFIENKNLRSEISESKTIIKDLFKSAKALEKKKISELKESENSDATKIKEKATSVIDKFKGIFKSDELYVIKLVVNEGINALKTIKPDKIDVKIKYGSSDPYLTGLLFSIAAPVYSIMGDGLNLKINGDKDFTESFMTLVGHPRLYKLMGAILRLLLNKKFRKVVFKKKK